MLTVLPNRALLTDRLRQALAIAAREQHRVAVYYLDLDGFKSIDDTHGHDGGDVVLGVVAQRLQGGVRPGDTVARLGGNEFVVSLAQVQGRADSVRVLQRLLADILRPIELASGALVHVGSSIGVVLFPSADELLLRADHAMFESERSGRCEIRFSDGYNVSSQGASRPKFLTPECAMQHRRWELPPQITNIASLPFRCMCEANCAVASLEIVFDEVHEESLVPIKDRMVVSGWQSDLDG